MNEVRANDLQTGDTFEEFGDGDPVTIEKLDYHGDTVLVTGTDSEGFQVERSYDIDTVLELVDRP